MSNIDHLRKPQLHTGSSVCQCSDCGRYFGGVTAFDTHLVRNANADVPPRCMTDLEMHVKGIHPNPHGVFGMTYRGLR